MGVAPLGKMVEVPLREVWLNEARDFTPWLSLNLDLLADALGLELELEGTETAVGPFAADVVLRDLNSDKRVIVENFLESSDHDHLGKLITYSAGLEGSIAVLIAKHLRPEHRSALIWLNDVSTSDASFFGIELKAVRIEDSLPAVQLDVIVQPDDWQRQVRETTGKQLSETEARYLDWWTEFLPALHETYPGWSSAQTPQKASWMNLPSGRSGPRYGISFAWPTGAAGYSLRVELYLDNGAALWPHFFAHRETIDAQLGPGLSWEELPESKASRIASYLEPVAPDDRERWGDYRSWALKRLGEFREAFQPIIAKLP